MSASVELAWIGGWNGRVQLPICPNLSEPTSYAGLSLRTFEI